MAARSAPTQDPPEQLAHLRKELQQEAYNAVSAVYRDEARHARQHEFLRLRHQVERLQEGARKENVTFNDTVAFREPIVDALHRVMEDSVASPRTTDSLEALRQTLGANASAVFDSLLAMRRSVEDGALESEAAVPAQTSLADASAPPSTTAPLLALASSTATTRTAPANAVAPAAQETTLFCFSLMMSSGPEVDLITLQVANRISIFACDDAAVFSHKRMKVGPGPPPYEVQTTPIHRNTLVGGGLKSHILNAEIFMRVWEAVFGMGTYERHTWTVKVDPDCVFFPPIAHAHLKTVWGNHAKSDKYRGAGLYLRNCAPTVRGGLGLFGALEVLSRGAVEAFARAKFVCAAHLDHSNEGEDLFLQQCLDLLKVAHVYDLGLVNDAYCAGKTIRPCKSGHAAFHPVKVPSEYSQCVREANFGGLLRVLPQ